MSTTNIKHIVIAILTGLILGVSQPLVISALSIKPIDPSGLTGLLALFGFVPLLVVLRDATPKRAFLLSWLACFVQYMIILNWIFVVLYVFANINFVYSIVICGLLSALLAFYVAVAFGIAHIICRSTNWPSWIIIPPSVTALTYVLNYCIFGGFPWGNIGYSLATVPVLLQQASIYGIYGMLFYVVLMNSTISSIIISKIYKKAFPIVPVAIALALTAIVLTYGAFKLGQPIPEDTQYLKVALLQGNIEQGIKNKAYQYTQEILTKYKRLQSKAVENGAEIIVWPESGYPSVVLASNRSMSYEFEPGNSPIILGAVVRDAELYYNSAVILDQKRNVLGRFDKGHLAPFGEYVPWPFKTIVGKIVPGLGQFGRGESFSPITVNIREGLDLKIGSTICYEGVFPEISRAFVKNGAELLVNVTNDAWYGFSSAPYQHLRMYSVRTVENGRGYLRATNTGVSAIIDYRGFITHPSDLYEEQLVIADVPIVKEDTIYLAIGDMVPQVSFGFILLSFIYSLKGTRIWRKKVLPISSQI